MSRVSSAESSTADPPSRVYACSLCPRVFPSAHALGGHQNAHRRERGDELAGIIRHRLHLDSSLISASASSDTPAAETGTTTNNNNAVFEVGESSHRRVQDKAEAEVEPKAEVEEEAEVKALSLELTLAVQGSGGNGVNANRMNYNYPDVLFPASEFMDTTVDLDLKL